MNSSRIRSNNCHQTRSYRAIRQCMITLPSIYWHTATRHLKSYRSPVTPHPTLMNPQPWPLYPAIADPFGSWSLRNGHALIWKHCHVCETWTSLIITNTRALTRFQCTLKGRKLSTSKGNSSRWWNRVRAGTGPGDLIQFRTKNVHTEIYCFDRSQFSRISIESNGTNPSVHDGNCLV